ncbi:hypothetical protein CLV70_111240 [Pseudosporangium ferrugineum]|uniref:Uncharacterized protein n=1 Tax=Pseudosporangium ferrugineum TaxID=439699 RepID=A0A2T0S1S3_9ACTN|nr:hypothetical protein CLV70_111240 [Pseudosporangium ferrugineum]
MRESGAQSTAYVWKSATSISSRGADQSSVSAGSRNRCSPMPTSQLPSRTDEPKISITQISPERSGTSSIPDIQNATMDRGVTTPRARTSTCP